MWSSAFQVAWKKTKIDEIKFYHENYAIKYHYRWKT